MGNYIKKASFGKKKLSTIHYPLVTKWGFTLVEVMLTVTILAIGIIGVLRGYAVSVDALGVGQENIDAICALKEKMAEIEQTTLEEGGLLPGISAGEFEGELEDFEWELEVKSDSVDNLNEVILTAFRKGKTRKFSLVTYVENKESE